MREHCKTFHLVSTAEYMGRLGFNQRDPRVLRALYVSFAAAHKFDKARYFAEQWQKLYGAAPPTLPTTVRQLQERERLEQENADVAESLPPLRDAA